MLKTINNLNPSFMNEIFPQRNHPYNLRKTNEFLVPNEHTVNYRGQHMWPDIGAARCRGAARYRGQRMWHSLPQEFKDAGSVQQFKKRIKFWKNGN